MKIYWSGTSKNIIGPRVRMLRRERGERFVPDYEVKVLARCLGVPYAALLDGNEDGKPENRP